MDDNAHAACYIFKPTTQEDGDINPRTPKRRRLVKPTSKTLEEDAPWPLLLGGLESQESVKLRKSLFESTWATQQAKLDKTGHTVDEELVEDVLNYRGRGETASQSGQESLPTHLLVASATTQHEFHQTLERRMQETSDKNDILVSLQPTHCSNLQTALKTIIKASIAGRRGEEAYADFLAENKALIPMNFDLELLHRYVQQENVERVLVSVTDVETFDTTVLSELVSTFHSWSDRIPFMLFIGISTTTELFESRFSRATINLLDAHFVETKPSGGAESTLFNMYETLQHDTATHIFLGSSIVNVLAELAGAQSTTPDNLVRALKYAYMSHFFANPLATLTAQFKTHVQWDPTLCDAIRNLPTFKDRCEALAQGDRAQRHRARQLLASNESLWTEAKAAIQAGQEYMSSCLGAIRTLRHLYHSKLHIRTDKNTPWETESDLLASLPDLTRSDTFKAIEDALKVRGITSLSEMLDGEAEPEPEPEPKEKTKTTQLNDLQNYLSETGSPVDQEAAAAAAFLRAYLHHRTSISPSCSSPPSSSPLQPGVSPFRQFLAEAYTMAHRSPLSQIVHPRPRHCIERALARPADYLGCSCCAGGGSADAATTTTATLPPTSVLVQMLNEAGAVINVRDLWDAFRDTLSSTRHGDESRSVEDEDEEEEEEDEDGTGAGAGAGAKARTERQVLALFYRALAELRYLGLIKQSRRKPGVECIQKTVWMGL
ncbi:hypothetical protein G647_02593 [Cladophialophora carrionii CBS 160.54]|uniref:Uncharacterized protein n=1 Tax=Cladophialophora carrionii CBS 160.54 TaxID=1279043 RepID=V9DIP2_9EURO|nr:uncharacterized protein G647_02593 [Cladophialophora carrionii CBS 160.54]ETI25817.1 hypothetical protein G647_02593 [Cladophialophora carrionii CBS 160.54]